MGAFDANPFGVNSDDGSEGDKDEAIKRNPRYDGPPGMDTKFEGEKANENVSAAQMNNTGRE